MGRLICKWCGYDGTAARRYVNPSGDRVTSQSANRDKHAEVEYYCPVCKRAED